MELFSYQKEAITALLRKVERYHGALLYGDVRTGKTRVCIALAQKLKVDTCLFVTKKSAIQSIQDEYKKVKDNGDLAFICINYELFRSKKFESLKLALHNQSVLVILDESHNIIGSHRTEENLTYNRIYRFLRDREKQTYCVTCTGTPNPESPLQYYRQIAIIPRNSLSVWFPTLWRFKDQGCDLAYDHVYIRGVLTKRENLSASKIKNVRVQFPNIVINPQEEVDMHIVRMKSQDVPNGKITWKKINITCQATEAALHQAAKREEYQFTCAGADVRIPFFNATRKAHALRQLAGGAFMYNSESFENGGFDNEEFTIKRLTKEEKFHHFMSGKCKYIAQCLEKGYRLAIYYYYHSEREMFKKVFPDIIHFENSSSIQEFNSNLSHRAIALQITACREGIRIDNVDKIIFYTLDHSCVSNLQAPARAQSYYNKVKDYSVEYLINKSKFSIDDDIYDSVFKKRKNFLLSKITFDDLQRKKGAEVPC